VLRAIDALMRGVRLACGLSFIAFCVLILVQVVNRYALGLPLFWTEEMVLLLFVWSVLLGMPAALWWRDEIVVNIIQLPASLDGKRLLVVDLLSIVFLLALTWSGLSFMQRGGISLSPSLGLPRSWFYASIPLGAVLSIVALVGRMAKPVSPKSDHNAHAAVAHD
jgi:TRAP-type C4-dicarboxylate transport system permease small subunit